MSSHPTGLRFSPFSTVALANNNNSLINNNMQQPQQATNKNKIHKQSQLPQQQQVQQQQPQQQFSVNSLSSSETDISTSNENLSMEQRYVLRHTPRVEPQGQENLQDIVPNVKENQGRYAPDQRFSSNTSTDSTRYASSNRSISETRNPMYNQSLTGTSSNRNSLKETNSNRSSMDVSTCSYNTLIIHNDDNIYIGNRDYPGQPDAMKKDRPRSYGEQMQEITEIPDDFLNQSHVLKHLAKEIKTPVNRRSTTRDSGMSDNLKDPPQYGQWTIEEQNEQNNNKIKSKSQPDLTKLTDIDVEAMESILKENQLLKQQLHSCYMKVAKTQKLEEEVANIYRVHDELKLTCERREKLEQAARLRLKSDLERVSELNRVMKDQMDILQTQLSAPSEHQILIAQLFTQNKELVAAKDRQEIELVAQRATLQEQRNHIGILDTALRNAQHNIRRLEDEMRKKQLYVERLTQLHGALQSKQNEQKMRLDYETELSKDSNRSGSSTNSDSKWQLQDKSQMMRLDSEQRHLDEQTMRQNVPKITLNKNIQDDRITEAQHDKLRYLEEVHSAQRKVNDLQTHLKVLDSKVAEKEAEIRILQEKKICGSSFDSYNSLRMNPLSYNSQTSFNASNTSFNTTTNTSLLDQSFGGNSTNFSPNQSPYVGPGYSQTKPTYNQSSVNLQAIAMSGNYSPNTNYMNNYDDTPTYSQNSPSSYETSYDNLTRKSIDDHMKKQLDEQLMSKRGLCCFPSLSAKKPNQPLLSDQVSVLSTNNSDVFLQLAHYDQRERERQEHQENQTNQTKSEDIVLLEKQGRCSQKLRNNATGNLAQVTHTVGQNMTDISNIGNPMVPKIVTNITQNLSNITQNGILPPRLKERSGSLPPSALPRPPRSLKPPRKIEYDRLSDTDLKCRAQTPPKNSSNQSKYDLKSNTMKRSEFGRRDFSPGKNFLDVKETLAFPKPDFSLKRKDYGSFSKPEYTSTRNYQRLEDSPKPIKTNQDIAYKRSLLPSSRKYATGTSNTGKNSRDSLNSSESNNSTNSNSRSSPVHIKSDSSTSNNTYHSRTPPKYAPPISPQEKSFLAARQQNNQQQRQQIKAASMMPTCTGNSSSLPPKPNDTKSGKRGSSLTRGENRYRIQF